RAGLTRSRAPVRRRSARSGLVATGYRAAGRQSGWCRTPRGYDLYLESLDPPAQGGELRGALRERPLEALRPVVLDAGEPLVRRERAVDALQRLCQLALERVAQGAGELRAQALGALAESLGHPPALHGQDDEA